jgi:hypothetical protein
MRNTAASWVLMKVWYCKGQQWSGAIQQGGCHQHACAGGREGRLYIQNDIQSGLFHATDIRHKGYKQAGAQHQLLQSSTINRWVG